MLKIFREYINHSGFAVYKFSKILRSFSLYRTRFYLLLRLFILAKWSTYFIFKKCNLFTSASDNKQKIAFLFCISFCKTFRTFSATLLCLKMYPSFVHESKLLTILFLHYLSVHLLLLNPCQLFMPEE